MKQIIRNTSLLFGIFAIIAFVAMAKQEKVLQIFQNGHVIQEYPISEIDYIEVNDQISAPGSVSADVSSNSITINWNEVPNAIYNLYRSPDNVNFSLLASGLQATSYTDNKPLNGTNYYRVKAVVGGIESGYSQSAVGTIANSDLDNGIYLGISAFNQALYDYPIMKVEETSINGFNDFIDELDMKNGTLLYYSVDKAIDRLQEAELPTDISTAAIVTFTDGLDQGSMMMDVPYVDNNEYLSALNSRIISETVCGQPITAYSIGIRGQDVADVTMFQNNLRKLASSDANAFEVSNMAEVNAKFREIAEQLSQSSYIQTINLKMPGVANGTIVRFTFDNVNDAAKSSLYIEGTFNLSARSLENVQYVGMTSSSGATIKGVQEGIFVNFSIEGVHTDNNKLIDSKFTDEWTYILSNNSWQINSEFDKTENSDVVTERSSAAIMLVLDCSSSLGTQFATAQNNAKDFVNTLYDSIGGNSGGGDSNNDKDNDEYLYSTTPRDLTLAVWKDGQRFYLTKEEYDKANLSTAIVEGLTIVAGGESFILELDDTQYDSISDVWTAKEIYRDIIPTAGQGEIISAKWTDINSALSSFDGNVLSENKSYYTLSTRYGENYWYYDYTLNGRGGSLSSSYDAPYIRGVKQTNSEGPIYWTDPNDLKLSVIIDGKREFLTPQEYQEKLAIIEEIEGIAIIAWGEKFVLQMHDAQTNSISDTSTAFKIYGDIIPSEAQGMIISAKWSNINSALNSFGGTMLSKDKYYYTLVTNYDEYNRYFNFTLYGSGGSLKDSYQIAPYIRGVKNILEEDEYSVSQN